MTRKPHALAGKPAWAMERALAKLQPKATFRLYCDRGKRGKFYECVILPRVRDVIKAGHIISGEWRGWSKCKGFCHALDVLRQTKRGWHPTRLAGYVVLAAGPLGSGYVSHELTHAAHFRLLRSGGSRRPFEGMALGDERISEPLADMQGWLVAQFWSAFFARWPQTSPGIVRAA